MLELYSNIKKYRKMFNMSQQALAEAVGYKGKSMIAQVENGHVDLSASMIAKFAEVFHVSELELMGLNDPIIPEPTDAEIQSLNRALRFVEKFDNAPPEIQAAIGNLLKLDQSDL